MTAEYQHAQPPFTRETSAIILAQMSSSGFSDFVSKPATPIHGLLIDLDGVVYVGDELVRGAAVALKRLRSSGVALRFLTNTSTKPVGAIEAKVRGLGVEVRPGEVVSAVRAAVMTLRTLGSTAPYLVVDERIAAEFAGFSPVGLFPDPPRKTPDWIVVGDIGPHWDYGLMNGLYEMLSGGARLLALHKGRSWQTETGLRLDIGAFIAGLEYAAGTEAVVTGKPSAEFFNAALGDMGVTPANAVMIGDDIDSDIGGAQTAGVRGVLVKTGKYREAYVARSTIVPWGTLSSLAEVETLPGLRPLE